MSENKESKNTEDNFEKFDKEQENVTQKSKKEHSTKQESTNEELLIQEKDRFLRLFAEFENYKKRTSKERLDLFKTANRELMTVLLPVLDDFDRGLAEIKKENDKELLRGMLLINDKFRKILEQKGLSLMKVKQGDLFDAEIHQAITQITAPKKKLVGKVLETVEQGYMLGDVIIRYPKVVVGK